MLLVFSSVCSDLFSLGVINRLRHPFLSSSRATTAVASNSFSKTLSHLGAVNVHSGRIHRGSSFLGSSFLLSPLSFFPGSIVISVVLCCTRCLCPCRTAANWAGSPDRLIFAAVFSRLRGRSRQRGTRSLAYLSSSRNFFASLVSSSKHSAR
jgi:hypothetical protein